MKTFQIFVFYNVELLVNVISYSQISLDCTSWRFIFQLCAYVLFVDFVCTTFLLNVVKYAKHLKIQVQYVILANSITSLFQYIFLFFFISFNDAKITIIVSERHYAHIINEITTIVLLLLLQFSLSTDVINLCGKIRIRKSRHYGGQAV